ncbi:MAG: FAD-dependent monooxygenase, partial [Candidatus Binataceae bacterium]
QFVQDGAIMAVESLAGKEVAWYIPNLNEGVRDISPTVRLFITQNMLEPILRKRAEELGSVVRFGTDMVSIERGAGGITAIIRDRDSGDEQAIHAEYLVAADGNRSPIREQLEIAMHGHGVLSNSITIYFSANCGPLLRDRKLSVIYVYNPLLRGFFRLEKSGGSGFLVVNTVGDTSQPGAANVADGITEDHCAELVRTAIGVPGMEVKIENIAPWKATADVAERFQDNRIFLAGDAAHVMPPNGGFGGNTGVQDAHNLAWKLALVIKGLASSALLSTYDAERRPVAKLTVEQAYTRYVTRSAPYLGKQNMEPLVEDLNIEVGYIYHSTAIAPENGGNSGVHENPRESHGRPGTRAPHIWLERAGERLSSIDLFKMNFVLMAGRDGEKWRDGARDAAQRLGLAIESYRIGEQNGLIDVEQPFNEAYGVSGSGAVLVRPDGFVAWRSKSSSETPGQTLTEVLTRLLGR